MLHRCLPVALLSLLVTCGTMPAGRAAPGDEWQYLGRLLTVDGFAETAPPEDSGFDGRGSSYMASGLPGGERLTVRSDRFGRVEFVRPPTDGDRPNMVPCQGQEIRITTTRTFNVLFWLGAAHDGEHFGWVELRFEDGTTARAPIGFSDWTLDPVLGEETAFVVPIAGKLAQSPGGRAHIWLQRTPIPGEKRLVSLKLPDAPNARILGLTLGRRDGERPVKPPSASRPDPGLVAIFSEPGFPYYFVRGDLAPERIQEELEAVGISAVLVDLEQLKSAEWFHAAAYPVLVLAYGNTFPADAEGALRAYRKAGGSMIHLGVPFTHPVDRSPYGGWIDRRHSGDFVSHDGARALGVGGFQTASAGDVVPQPELAAWGVDGVEWSRFLLRDAEMPPHDDFVLQSIPRSSLGEDDEVVPLLAIGSDTESPIAALIRHRSCEFAGCTDLRLGPLVAGMEPREGPLELATQLIVRGAAALLREKGLIDESVWKRASSPIAEGARAPEALEPVPPPRPRDRSLPEAPLRGGRGYWVDLSKVQSADRVLLASAQGLIHRDRPDTLVFLADDAEAVVAARWYADHGDLDGLEPIEPSALLDLLGHRRAVVVDPDLQGSLNLAVAVAAAEGVLVAYPWVVARYGLEVVADLRGLFEGQADGYAWVIDHVLERLEPAALAMIEPTPESYGLIDYLVAQRIVPFWISWQRDRALRGASWEREVAVAARLLARTPTATPVLTAPSDVAGAAAIRLLSRFGKYAVAVDGLSNLSFTSRLAPSSEPPATTEPPAEPPPPPATETVHVAWVAEDAASLQAAASWRPDEVNEPLLARGGLLLAPEALELFPARVGVTAAHLRSAGVLVSPGLGRVDLRLYGSAYGDAGPRVQAEYWELVDRTLRRYGQRALRVEGWREPRDAVLEAYARGVPTARTLLAAYRANAPITPLQASYVLEGTPVLHAVSSDLATLKPEDVLLGSVPSGQAVFVWASCSADALSELPREVPGLRLHPPVSTGTLAKTYHERLAPERVVLVSQGAVWKYHDTGQDLGKDWVGTEYDDGAWASGPAELGFGDSGEGRPERTTLSFGGDDQKKHPTTYFRLSFKAEGIGDLLSLALEVVRDDGCVVYLNGAEVGRSNMPEGEVSFSTYARSAVSSDDEAAWIPIEISPAGLREGANVLAVEMHQNNGRSSDLSFDLRLSGFRARGSGPRVESGSSPSESSK